jgi:O-antigen/teichoic acid export membrane protein
LTSSPKIERIKRLGSDTAVYGISTILGRFLTFVLTPIYTHALNPADLGVVANVYAYIAFLNVVYGYGMEGAYMKYVSTLELGDKKQVFTVPFVAVALSGLLFSGFLTFFYGPVAALSGVPERYDMLVLMAAGILFLDALSIVPFASLRMAHKAKVFAGIKIAGIVVNVATNILFLFRWHTGVEGIFLSGLISSGFTVVLLIPTVMKNFAPSWPRGVLLALLRFGLPSVPAGIAGMMLQVINRPILASLRGDAAVGIFQANYRLGIFMMLLVSMFDFAWRPFLLQHARDEDARPLFARVMTYFVLVATGVFLVMSFFLADIVRWPFLGGHSIIDPRFWAGMDIIPVILLAYVFLGIYNNLIAGIYIEKKTGKLPLVTFTAAALHVVANYALIPSFGLMGAAFATLASYVVMAGMMYIIVQKIYPVQYELGRLGKIAVAAVIVSAGALIAGSGTMAIAIKLALIPAFVAILYVTRFFEPHEWAAAVRLVRSVPGARSGKASGDDAPSAS